MCGATAVQCSTKYGSNIYIKQAEVSMSKIALVGLKFDVTPPHHRQGVCGVLHSAGRYVYSSGRRCGGLCTHSQSMLSHTVNPATTTNCLPLPNSTSNALYSRPRTTVYLVTWPSLQLLGVQFLRLVVGVFCIVPLMRLQFSFSLVKCKNLPTVDLLANFINLPFT